MQTYINNAYLHQYEEQCRLSEALLFPGHCLTFLSDLQCQSLGHDRGLQYLYPFEY